MRRRQRRLRSMLRHEQQTVRMVLALVEHHSHVAFFTLDDESVPVTGLRPTCLVEPRGPQEAVQRHTVEHIVDVCPFVQILDVLVSQMGIHAEAGHFYPSSLSQCPRSLRTVSRSAWWIAIFVFRRGRNSWWRCRLPCLFLLCSSSLPSH